MRNNITLRKKKCLEPGLLHKVARFQGLGKKRKEKKKMHAVSRLIFTSVSRGFIQKLTLLYKEHPDADCDKQTALPAKY